MNFVHSILIVATASALMFCLPSTTVIAQQNPTDLVNEGMSTTTPPRVGGEVVFEIAVRNEGPEVALMYLVQITVFRGVDPVFQDFVAMPELLPSESATATMPNAWTPDAAGMYTVQSQVALAEDSNPVNNERIQNLEVLPSYISLEEATVILVDEVISNLPDPTIVKAYYNGPPSNPNDSVHLKGTLVETLDGESFEIEFPSYIFFVDAMPGELWNHPATVVTISAEANSGLPLAQADTDHPITIDGESFDFGPDCGANSKRVVGGAFN